MPPDKVKSFLLKNFNEELKYFQKKYRIKVELLSNEELIIPEYKIELLNKSKKILNLIENIKNIVEPKKKAKDKTSEKELKDVEKRNNKI